MKMFCRMGVSGRTTMNRREFLMERTMWDIPEAQIFEAVLWGMPLDAIQQTTDEFRMLREFIGHLNGLPKETRAGLLDAAKFLLEYARRQNAPDTIARLRLAARR